MGQFLSSSPPGLSFRPCLGGDLEATNALIASAVMTWNLAERVKRLSLPLYCYGPDDLDHLTVLLAEEGGIQASLAGVAAWEPAEATAVPPGCRGLLLHGLYVSPGRQRCGVGAALLGRCLDAARSAGVDGVLVKAQRDSAAFFAARGMQPLAVEDAARDYPLRFWAAV